MTPETSSILADLARRLGLITEEQQFDPAQAWARDAALLSELAIRISGMPLQQGTNQGATVMPSRSQSAEVPGTGGRYEVKGEIGRGGLGAVMAAHDQALGREVALKLMREDMGAENTARFVREARITGQLEHPNIIPVHELGRMADTGRAFYTMKRVVGRDLGEVIRGLSKGDRDLTARFPLRRLLDHFRDVCLAMAYAHSRGVIHRDLKPANVMIGEFGETLVVDWGLAKKIAEKDERGTQRMTPNLGLTMEGDVMGTPAYMSPEQASGAELSALSDIWSLGAILYEMLTLRPPIEGESVDEIISRAKTGEVQAPSRRSAPAGLSASRIEVLPELEAICMKCLRPDPRERFASAADLAREIEQYLDGDKERARARREAQERVFEGRHHAKRYRQLGEELREARLRAEALTRGTSRVARMSDRRPIFQAADDVRALEEERIRAFTRASATFAQAQLADRDCHDAAEEMCSLLVDQYLEAEQSGNRNGMLLHRNQLREQEGGARHEARLDAPGRLSVRAWSRDCACLKPVKVPGWRVEVSAETHVVLRDGRPRPGEKAESQFLLPGVRLHPAGAGFGHRDECPRREVMGARVSVARYELRDRLLVPMSAQELGLTPLQGVVLPQGSYLGQIFPPGGGDPVKFTFVIARESEWTQEIHFYAAEEIPDGFALVPGGVFNWPARTMDGPVHFEPRRSEDVFVARKHVTMGDYAAFLTSIAAQGRLQEARQRMPRDGDEKVFVEEDGRFFPDPHHFHDIDDAGKFPVNAVSWNDSVAYSVWLSAREGRLFRPLTVEEYEKGARGADTREFPWGAEYHPPCANTSMATEGSIPGLLKSGSFAIDESPYGLLDMAGNLQSWCWNTALAPYRQFRIIRGSAYCTTPDYARAGYLSGDLPNLARASYGIRLCMPVMSQV